ncbi:MAG TPA: hypothetical protein PLV46_01665 [Reyranella sp.]|uniref:hypothetical protein n=1 Tax=Reyranella sp. TaxID=1929291 RepID=UPI002B5D2409|nr:hypothetical protein [Reyranella sp.]HQS13657.1 hypothetical protein [Reyranella sp.]HQT10142.1 hypothetical protein [Reyranella sp.]
MLLIAFSSVEWLCIFNAVLRSALQEFGGLPDRYEASSVRHNPEPLLGVFALFLPRREGFWGTDVASYR